MDWGLTLFLSGVALLAALRFSLPRRTRVPGATVPSPVAESPEAGSSALPGLPSTPGDAAAASAGTTAAPVGAPKAT